MKTKSNDEVKILVSPRLLSLLEDLTEKKYEQEEGKSISLYYEDYTLHSISLTPKGIHVKYTKKGADTIYGNFKFNELHDE